MIAQHRSVIVVGGGVSGLTTAYHLKNSGVDVALLESAPAVGGCARTEEKNGFLLEQGPFNIMVRDPSFERLLTNLEHDVTVVSASKDAKARFIYHRGKLHCVPTNPLKILTTQLLSKRARMRLLKGLLWSRSAGEGEESFDQVVTRRLGPEVADVMVSAAINGILAGDIRKLTLRACYPKIAQIDAEMRSPIGYALKKAFFGRKGTKRHRRKWRGLVSIDGGLGALMDALAKPLGDDCLTGCRVLSLRRSASGYEIEYALQDDPAKKLVATCDHVVMALPVEPAAKVLQEEFAEAAEIIRPIPSSPLAVLNLGYRREDVGHPLRGFGFLVPRTETALPIMGALWADSIFPHHAPGDHRLIRVFIGGALQPDVLQLTDAELLSRAKFALKDVLQVTGDPVLIDTIRYKAAIPQYHAGHRQRIVRFREELAKHPGLYVVGNYLDGASLNDCVRVATECAQQVLEDVSAAERRAEPSVRSSKGTAGVTRNNYAPAGKRRIDHDETITLA